MGTELHRGIKNIPEYERTKLEEELTAQLKKPLLLVVAPSGYGKFTWIRQYFMKHPEIFCMGFSMQSVEADENWLWRKLCKRLETRNAEIHERLSRMDLPQSAQEIAYVVRILKQYMTRETYLIIDEFQECHSQPMNRLLLEVVQQVQKLHVLLIARTYPEIPYEELFLKGCCGVFDQQSLTLQKDEVAEIFRIGDLTLTEEELETVYQYTDGWICAVYLALYEYEKNGCFGGFLGVNHRMKTAIFDKLDPQMQIYYMKMSAFEWFHIEGAAYVSEMDISENMLFESIAEFGFVHYEPLEHTFKMHALLRNVAFDQLQKSDIDVRRLYNRAAEWSQKKGSYVTAVCYYKKAENWEQIARLYAGKQGKGMIGQAPEIFEDVRESIWQSIWARNPMAYLNYLYYLAMKERREKVYPLYEKACAMIADSPVFCADTRLLGEMQVIRSLLAFNDIKAMTEGLKEACRLLGDETSVLLENTLLTYGTTCMTNLYYRQSGRLKETIEQEKAYARCYMQLTRGGLEGWDDFFDAEYALLRCDMKKAYALAEQVCAYTTIRKQSCIMISCYYIMLRCLVFFGKKSEFYQKIREMKETLSDVADPLLVIDMELVEGYVYACLGRRAQMADWLRDFSLDNCSPQIRSIRSGCVTYGRLLCSEKNWELLDIISSQMLVAYQSNVHVLTKILGYIYKAIAAYYREHETVAVRYLKEAIALAEPDGEKISFVENGRELKPILEKLPPSAFVTSVLKLVQQYEKGIAVFLRREEKKQRLLTRREKELMTYVKAGYRNAQISEAMHIAQVTVEKNLTKVYRKLGVKNRTGAITKLQELGEL